MKEMKHLVFFLLLSAWMTSLKSQGIVVSDELKTNTSVMDAKGKQGWQFSQVIKYGGFRTSKIKRSWPSGFDIDFIERFRSAREKLGFTQYSPDSLSCTIIAVGRFSSDEPIF